MKLIEDLQNIFSECSLLNIFVVGYTSPGNCVHEYRIMYETIYLQFEDTLCRFHSGYDDDEVVLTVENKIECEFDLENGEEFTVASINEMYLKNLDTNYKVSAIDLYSNKELTNEMLSFKAIGVSLTNNEYLFFDPICYHGVQLGHAEEKNAWEFDVLPVLSCTKHQWFMKAGIFEKNQNDRKSE